MFDRTMTRIMTMVRKDLRTSMRDQLSLYILVSPLLLGLLLYLIAPLFEDMRPTFVTTDALSLEHREALERHALLEVVPDRAALEQRVLGPDDATGVLPITSPGAETELEIIIQGDEPEALHTLAHAIIEHGDELPPTSREPGSLADFRRIVAALLGFCVPALAALLIGFAILEEKTSNTRLIYAVSPLRFGEYLTAKLGLLVVLSLLMLVPTLAIPLGFGLDWLAIFVMVLASLPFAACYGLLLGVFAKDQLGAIGLIKMLSPVWTSLPFLGFVLPDAWMWTQFPFANHWAVQGFYHALVDGQDIGRHALLSFATGLPVLIVTAVLLRRRLGFAGSR